MNRIDATFAALKRSGKKALIGYVTAGFPAKSSFVHNLIRLEKAGLDLLEIGVPFSDPVADGPTIQKSSYKALANGVTLAWVLHTVKQLRPQVHCPILLMTYANPLVSMGLERFFAKAAAAGVDGVIIPDLIPEEGAAFEKPARRHGVAVVYLAAPTTTPDRLQRIVTASQGFVYAVSLTGVTGARVALPADLSRFLNSLRKRSRKPVAVGFGISTADHIRFIRASTDGVIVGSALIHHLEKSLKSAEAFVASLQKTLNPNSSRS